MRKKEIKENCAHFKKRSKKRLKVKFVGGGGECDIIKCIKIKRNCKNRDFFP